MAPRARVQLLIDARGAKKAARDVDEAAKATRGLGRDTDQAGAKARKTAKDFDVLANVQKLMRPAALITAAGLAAGAMSAAGTGAVAFGAGLAPLSGLAVSAGAGLLAYQSALGLVQASMGGVATSMDGVFGRFDDATPMTNRLAATVRDLVPELLHLRNVAQSRLLSGVIGGIKEARPLIGTLTEPIARTASALGALATDAGAMARELGPEMARVLNTNVGIIRDVGGAGLLLAVVLVRLLDAARPLTAWLGRLALAGAQVASAAANAGTRSGALAGFFARVRVVAAQVGSILASVGVTLWNVGKAAGPLGSDLVGALQRAAAAMADWSGSARGQDALAGFFAQARPVLAQIAGLIGDVARGLATVMGSSNLAPLIAQIRGLVPILTRVVSGTTAAFGPALVNLIVQLARAFEPLAGSSGPLVLLTQVMGKVAQASAWIASSVPGGAAAITTLAGAFAVFQALGIASAASSLFGLRRGLDVAKGAYAGVTGAIDTARTAMGAMRAVYVAQTGVQNASTLAVLRSVIAQKAAAVATRGMAAAQTLLNLVMRANPILLAITALLALGAGLVVAYNRVAWFRGLVQGAMRGAAAAFRWLTGAAASVLGWLSANWPTVLAVLTGPIGLAVLAIRSKWDTLTGAASAVVGAVRSTFGRLLSFFTGMPDRIAGAASGMFDGIRDAFKGAINWIIGKWNAFELRVPEVNTHIPGVGKVGGMSIGTPDIPMLARGGTVRGPRIVGENGPEYEQPLAGGRTRVVPLTRGQRTMLPPTLTGAYGVTDPPAPRAPAQHPATGDGTQAVVAALGRIERRLQRVEVAAGSAKTVISEREERRMQASARARARADDIRRGPR